MKRMHFAVVALTVGTHLAYLIYLPSGGFLALRWPRTILLHVPTVVWGFGAAALHFPCPLTSLERWARARAQMDPLPAGGFIDRYAAGVLYPANRTGVAQTLAFLAAAVSWVLLGWQRRRAQPAARQHLAATVPCSRSPARATAAR